MKNERSGKEISAQDPKFAKALKEAQLWSSKYKGDPKTIPDSEIPTSWDFRNIGGYDFTGMLRD